MEALAQLNTESLPAPIILADDAMAAPLMADDDAPTTVDDAPTKVVVVEQQPSSAVAAEQQQQPLAVVAEQQQPSADVVEQPQQSQQQEANEEDGHGELEEGELDSDDDDLPTITSTTTSHSAISSSKTSETKDKDSSKSKSDKDRKSSNSSKDKSSSSGTGSRGGDVGRRSSSSSATSKPKDSSKDNNSSSKSSKKRPRDGEEDDAGRSASKRGRGARGSPITRRNSGSGSDATDSDSELSSAMLMKSMVDQMSKMMKKEKGSGGSKTKMTPEASVLQAMIEKMKMMSSSEVKAMARSNGFRGPSRDHDSRLGAGDRIRGRPDRERRDRRGRGATERRRERGDRGGVDILRGGRGGEKDIESSGPKRRERDVHRQVCKFYLDAKCHKGLDCPFSHDVQVQKRREICKFYLQGQCGKGDQCLFLHNSFPCKFFHTGAECYSGDACRFSHEPLTDDTRSMLRCYLDSGELPDDHMRENSGNANTTKLGSGPGMMAMTGNSEDITPDDSVGGYQPMRPVAKRHSVMGEVTAGMRTSFYTWVWQQEMKELENAYVGNKRNLFCIDKEFTMTDKPPTPPPEEFEDPDEREFAVAMATGGPPTVASFYIDTMGDTDQRIQPMAGLGAPVANEHEDEYLLEASFHDEDFRLPPPMIVASGDISNPMDLPLASSSMSSPALGQDSNSQAYASSTSDLNVTDGSSLQNVLIPPPPLTLHANPNVALDPRLALRQEQQVGAQKRGWLSESDDDTTDAPVHAALKRLEQNPAQLAAAGGGQDTVPSAPGPSNGKPKFDIAKMLNVIKQLSNPAAATPAATGTLAATTSSTSGPAGSAAKSEFWQNVFSGTNYAADGSIVSGGAPGPVGSTDMRDPRLRRNQSSSSLLVGGGGSGGNSQESNSLSAPSSGKDLLQQTLAMSGASADQGGEPGTSSLSVASKDDWCLHEVTIEPIDYAPYLIYCTGDSKLKNDPRLQKLLGT